MNLHSPSRFLLISVLMAYTVEVREHQRVADNELDFGDFIANFYKWTPVIDGELVLDQPLTVWRYEWANACFLLTVHDHS